MNKRINLKSLSITSAMLAGMVLPVGTSFAQNVFAASTMGNQNLTDKLGQAKKRTAQAKSNLDLAKNNLLKAQTSADQSQKISIDDAYKRAISTNPSTIGYNELVRSASADLLKQNSYKPTGETEEINVNHLTDTQKTELRQFFLGLINQVRSQMGYEPLVYNNSAMKMADALVQDYQADNWQAEKQGHDVSALKKAYTDFGMSRYYEESMGFLKPGWVPDYANTTQNSMTQLTSAKDPKKITMDDAKNNLYGVVINMLFNDEASNWGHAQSLTHKDSISIGLGFDVLSNGDLAFHMLPVNPDYVDDKTKFNLQDNSSLNNKIDLSSYQAAVVKAQKEYDQAKDDEQVLQKQADAQSHQSSSSTASSSKNSSSGLMSSSSSASSNTSSSLSSDFNPDTSQDSDLVYNFNRKTYVQFPGQDKILINTDHIEFDRAYEKDPITGKITPKNWGKDEQIPDIETPEYDGYHVGKIIGNPNRATISHDTKSYDVIYQMVANKQSVNINFVNDAGEVVSSQKIVGHTGQTIKFTEDSFEIPANYRIKGNTKYPTSITFGAKPMSDITIHIESNTQKVGTQTKTVTRRIVVHMPHKADQVIKQIVTFNRNEIKDPVTGKISYGKWSKAINYPEFKVPKFNGLKADKKVIPAQKVSAEDSDSTAEITYTATQQSMHVHFVDQSGHEVGSQTVSGLTGEPVPMTLQIPDGYTLVGGQEYPSSITFGTNPFKDITLKVQPKDAEKPAEQKDAQKYNVTISTFEAKEGEPVTSAQRVVANYDKLPAGTKISWLKEPHTDKANSDSAEIEITYPDSSKAKANVPVFIITDQKGSHDVYVPSDPSQGSSTDPKLDPTIPPHSTDDKPDQPHSPSTGDNPDASSSSDSDSTSVLSSSTISSGSKSESSTTSSSGLSSVSTSSSTGSKSESSTNTSMSDSKSESDSSVSSSGVSSENSHTSASDSSSDESKSSASESKSDTSSSSLSGDKSETSNDNSDSESEKSISVSESKSDISTSHASGSSSDASSSTSSESKSDSISDTLSGTKSDIPTDTSSGINSEKESTASSENNSAQGNVAGTNQVAIQNDLNKAIETANSVKRSRAYTDASPAEKQAFDSALINAQKQTAARDNNVKQNAADKLNQAINQLKPTQDERAGRVKAGNNSDKASYAGRKALPQTGEMQESAIIALGLISMGLTAVIGRNLKRN